MTEESKNFDQWYCINKLLSWSPGPAGGAVSVVGMSFESVTQTRQGRNYVSVVFLWSTSQPSLDSIRGDRAKTQSYEVPLVP